MSVTCVFNIVFRMEIKLHFLGRFSPLIWRLLRQNLSHVMIIKIFFKSMVRVNMSVPLNLTIFQVNSVYAVELQ